MDKSMELWVLMENHRNYSKLLTTCILVGWKTDVLGKLEIGWDLPWFF